MRGTLSHSGGEVRLGIGVGYPSWITGTVAGGTFVLTLRLGPMLFAKKWHIANCGGLSIEGGNI